MIFNTLCAIFGISLTFIFYHRVTNVHASLNLFNLHMCYSQLQIYFDITPLKITIKFIH